MAAAVNNEWAVEVNDLWRVELVDLAYEGSLVGRYGQPLPDRVRDQGNGLDGEVDKVPASDAGTPRTLVKGGRDLIPGRGTPPAVKLTRSGPAIPCGPGSSSGVLIEPCWGRVWVMPTDRANR